jgi:hypothetical protein
MPVGKKCLTCNGCLDLIYIIPRRFFYCAFCKIHYDVIDNKITKVDVEEEVKKHTELLIKQQVDKEKELVNERFSQG